MNKFKLGDTVWTIKRGKGRIVSDYYESTGYRPFFVRFGHNPNRTYTPQLSNLYRTEAEMIEAKEAWRKANPAILPRPIATIWMNEIPFCFDINNIIRTEKPPQPKFKQGDKVYWNGKKHTITEVYPSHREYRYNMTRPMGDSDTCVIGVTESNLRLWKEHEFTHMACGNEPTNMRISGIDDISRHRINPSAYKSVTYLGISTSKMDTFHCVTNEGTSVIIYGKKGDV